MASPLQASTTPILDLLKPLPKPLVDGFTLRTFIPVILMIVFPILTGNALLAIFLIGLVLAFLFISFWLTAIHELGHLLAGWSVGLRFEQLEVGPLRIEHESGLWKLRARRHLTGGSTHMSLDRILRVRRRLILFIAGGPAANLLTGVIALLVLPMLDNGSFLQPIFGWTGILSLLMGIGNLSTKRIGRHILDGFKLRTLLTSKEGTKQLIAIHAIGMLKNRNIDPAQWNHRWARIACLPGEIVQNTYFADLLAYRATADSSSTTAALHLESCLGGSGFLDSKARDELLLEATVFTAWYRDDAVKADAWFKRIVRPDQVEPFLRIRAEVALHCVHRRFSEALRKCEDGLALIQDLPQSKAALCEPSWLEWRSEIEQRRDQTLTKQATST